MLTIQIGVNGMHYSPPDEDLKLGVMYVHIQLFGLQSGNEHLEIHLGTKSRITYGNEHLEMSYLQALGMVDTDRVTGVSQEVPQKGPTRRVWEFRNLHQMLMQLTEDAIAHHYCSDFTTTVFESKLYKLAQLNWFVAENKVASCPALRELIEDAISNKKEALGVHDYSIHKQVPVADMFNRPLQARCMKLIDGVKSFMKEEFNKRLTPHCLLGKVIGATYQDP
jgi:hypothetical protein